MTLVGIEAVLFDMDGTLIDSEVLAERVVLDLLADSGIEGAGGDPSRFHGVTWRAIERLLLEAHPTLTGVAVAERLQAAYHEAFFAGLPPELPGARAAVRAAGARGPAAIVSSSNRESIDLVIERLELGDSVTLIVGAEDCTRSKPDPQPYQIAAERLKHAPGACLVFEDSLAGLRAARNAGMRTVAITRHKQGDILESARGLADLAIDDYTELPQDFFTVISGGRA